MIVCHCNVLSGGQIRQAVVGMLDDDPHRVIVPVLTLRALGCRGKCCNCFPHLASIIASTIDEHRTEPGQIQPGENDHEGREIRHRAA